VRSAAAAVAWLIGRRHRWGLIAVVAYLLVLAILRLLIFERGRPVVFEDAESFGFFVMVPLASTFMYFLAVFSFGLAGDMAARESMYPARMFTLPVTTAALAGWPMLYGTSAMALLWLATRLLALWPSGVFVPVAWPALLAAAYLAWTQALTWMPYPVRGLRVIVMIALLVSIDVVVLLALEYRAPEPLMLVILAPLVPLAYLAACFAVARARRGDVPDWPGVFTRSGRIAVAAPPRRGRWTPARAQAWLEWRQYGRSLPLLVAILLPFELFFLFVFRSTEVIVFETLLAVLLTPPLMATFVAATVSKSNGAASDSYGVTPFIAARPLTNASLVAAKLKVTLWSTLVAWLLILVAVPLALRLSGTAPIVLERARRLIEVFGAPRATTMMLLGLAALVASTWKQLVQSLYIGMSGRQWAVKASVFLTLALLAVVVPLVRWIVTSRNVMSVLWNGFPWIVAVLVCCKLTAAAWVITRLQDGRLFRGRDLVMAAACWNLVVFTLYGLLAWIVPGLLSRGYLLLLIAILAIPLARLSAAPLALAWNRHR